MPYDTISELPDNVRNVLPEAAQRIWLKAFNSAVSRGESEDTARRIAWTAVENAGYSKGDNGKWTKMSDTTHLFVSEIFDSDDKHAVKYERSPDGEQLVRGLPLMKPGFWNGHEYSLTELREVADNFEQLQSDADYEPALLPFHTYDKEGKKTNIDAREIQGYFADVYVDDNLGWLLGDVRVVDDDLVQNMMRGKFRYTSTELADYEESGLTLVNTAWVDNPSIKGMPWELVMNREEFVDIRTLQDTTESDPDKQTVLPPACFLIVGDDEKPTTWSLPYRDADKSSEKTDRWGSVERYTSAGPINCGRVRAALAALRGARGSDITPGDLNESGRGKLRGAVEACEIESEVVENLFEQTRIQGGDEPMTLDEFKEAVEELLKADETPEIFADLTVEQLQDFWPAETGEDEGTEEEDETEQLSEDSEEVAQLKEEVDQLKAERDQDRRERRERRADETVRRLLDEKHIFPAQQEKVRSLLTNAESEEQVEQLVEAFEVGDLSMYFEQVSEVRDTDEELADKAEESVKRVSGKGGD